MDHSCHGSNEGVQADESDRCEGKRDTEGSVLAVQPCTAAPHFNIDKIFPGSRPLVSIF